MSIKNNIIKEIKRIIKDIIDNLIENENISFDANEVT